MTQKREDVMHPPEPWKVFDIGDGQYEIDHAGNGSIDGFHSKETADRIVACVNFCCGVPIEYLETHGLVHYLSPNGKDEIYYSFPSSMCFQKEGAE